MPAGVTVTPGAAPPVSAPVAASPPGSATPPAAGLAPAASKTSPAMGPAGNVSTLLAFSMTRLQRLRLLPQCTGALTRHEVALS